ncbi:unnamed protein product [Symbiodinium sp. CCMP2592]|nr:unnamed protein product [Symbiodinium sp. CCMP2592]
MKEDVIAVSETHATDKSQKTLDAGSDRNVFWGAPVDEKSRCGVSLLVRKSCAWDVRTLSFQGACDKYSKQGRLHANQLFRNDGKRSFLIYCLYGHAGARWEADKRVLLHEMLDSVFQDVAMRGGIPAIVVGDFNTEVTESAVLEQMVTCDWFDAVGWSTQDTASMKTSLKGGGSRIDLCFMNKESAGLCRSFETYGAPVKTDHRVISAQFDWPLAKQVRYMVKNVGVKCKYQDPPAAFVPDVVDSFDVRQALTRGDINKALDVWCRKADALLARILLSGVSADARDVGNGRGKELLCMQAYGYRADITWRNIAHVRKYLEGDALSCFDELYRGGLTRTNAGDMHRFLNEHCQRAQTRCRNARLKAWKSRVRESEKDAYRWLKPLNSNAGKVMKLPDGSFTATEETQLRAILDARQPIFQKFGEREPRVEQFFEFFGQTMRSSEMHLQDITGADSVAAALDTAPSSPGLDHFRPESLTALAKWYPQLFDSRALLFNWIELHSIWTDEMIYAYTALVPKSSMSSEASPGEYRPISVLSMVCGVNTGLVVVTVARGVD